MCIYVCVCLFIVCVCVYVCISSPANRSLLTV